MSRLVIATALMAEAVPLVDYYRLSKQPKQAYFHLFRGTALKSHQGIDVVVSGIGAKNFYRGLSAYLCSSGGGRNDIYLNFGIAGTLNHELGDMLWVNLIAGTEIGLPEGEFNQRPLALQSLVEPCTDYQAGLMFDMEAESWLKCIEENTQQFEPERMFCAKVVSDNQSRNANRIDKSQVTDLLRKNINRLDNTINILLKTIE